MGNQDEKARCFSVELKSKTHLKNIMVANSGSPESVMIEGALGELLEAHFTEGIILEVVGTNGVLRVDLEDQEITRPSQNEKDEGEKQ